MGERNRLIFSTVFGDFHSHCVILVPLFPFPQFDLHQIKWTVRRWLPWLVPLHRRLYAIRTRNQSVESIFGSIYQNRWWGKGETVSGLGSRATANQTLINALPGLFEQHAIKTVLDAPCGDFNWMSRVDLSGVSYTGADIVAELIEDNLVKHARPGVSFCLLNLLADPIPQSDLIICKDLMIHLSNV